MSTVSVQYRLPVTMVTISGRRTYTKNEIVAPNETVLRESAVAIEIVADPSSERTLTVPAPTRGQVSTKVSVAADGRLTGVKATSKDQSSEQLKAALQVGFGAAGALAPFVAPLGLVGAGIAVTVGTAAAALAASSGSGVWKLYREATDESDDAPEIVPNAEDLGIHRIYVQEHPSEAEALRGLLWSQLLLQRQLAWSAPDRDARAIRDLSRSLATVRAELARAQSHYSSWVESKTRVIRRDSFRKLFTMDQLPNTDALRQSAAQGLNGRDGSWAALFEDLRIAVSCDLDASQGSPGTDATTDQSSTVWYRRPQLATITTWRVEKDEPGKYSLIPEKVERKVVVLRNTERVVALHHGRDDATVGLEFDGDGLLNSIEVDRADSSVKRSEALGSLPSLAKDAFEAGSALSQPWTTAQRAAEVKARVELLESERKLAQLTGPAAPPDPRQKQLENVELEARIAAAQAIVDEPTRSLYLLRSVDSA
jgi:hypothetical protein